MCNVNISCLTSATVYRIDLVLNRSSKMIWSMFRVLLNRQIWCRQAWFYYFVTAIHVCYEPATETSRRRCRLIIRFGQRWINVPLSRYMHNQNSVDPSCFLVNLFQSRFRKCDAFRPCSSWRILLFRGRCSLSTLLSYTNFRGTRLCFYLKCNHQKMSRKAPLYSSIPSRRRIDNL
jgi:hypothetical protein